MTPHEIHLQTQRLEDEITDALRRIMDRYTEATGASPAAIHIDTVDISPPGALRKFYIVGGCRVRVDWQEFQA